MQASSALACDGVAGFEHRLLPHRYSRASQVAANSDMACQYLAAVPDARGLAGSRSVVLVDGLVPDYTSGSRCSLQFSPP